MLDSLLASCLVGGITPALMKPLVKTESAYQKYAIHNGRYGKAYFPKTKGQAVMLARKFLKKGHRLDLGYTQINTQNLRWLNLSVGQVLDPCTNLKAGSAVLSYNLKLLNYGKITNKKAKEKALLQAYSMYNTGRKDKGFKNGYVRKILKNGLKTRHFKNLKLAKADKPEFSNDTFKVKAKAVDKHKGTFSNKYAVSSFSPGF